MGRIAAPEQRRRGRRAAQRGGHHLRAAGERRQREDDDDDLRGDRLPRGHVAPSMPVTNPKRSHNPGGSALPPPDHQTATSRQHLLPEDDLEEEAEYSPTRSAPAP
mmetsp:Transcript_23466/g.93007  ORF Transcript_23466/g.93007 Transcript_23466/m.93007 type:complete len:106 (-) Transcript_23466:1188-1505(-)